MASLCNLQIGRPITSYAVVQQFAAACLRNRRVQLRNRRLRDLRYLDVGCGANTHPNFINLDFGWRPGVDLCWDIRRGIPLASRSLDGIFSEHVIEHLDPDAAERFLIECQRVLAPGKRLRIVVPDAELWLTLYVDRMRGVTDALFPYQQDPTIEPMMSINGIFYIARDSPAGHRCMYDFRLLRARLLRCGFSDITRVSFRTGADPTLLIDSEVREVESLYVEAIG
jgi:predicted SAM-dependent methyltransferase